MTTRPVECVAEDSLGEVLALPPADPRRAHLESCPRCRALATSYRQFLQPTAEEAGAYGTHEEARLTGFRERLSQSEPAAAGLVSAPAPPAEFRDRQPARESLWSRLFAPAHRPAWALATLVVVAGGLWLGPQMRTREPEPVLRGGAAPALAIRETTALPEGGLRVSWQPHPEADGYQLRFYSAALAEIARRDVGADPTVTIAAAEMPEPYRAGDVVLYRVVAMKGGDEIEASAPESLRKP